MFGAKGQAVLLFVLAGLLSTPAFGLDDIRLEPVDKGSINCSAAGCAVERRFRAIAAEMHGGEITVNFAGRFYVDNRPAGECQRTLVFRLPATGTTMSGRLSCFSTEGGPVYATFMASHRGTPSLDFITTRVDLLGGYGGGGGRGGGGGGGGTAPTILLVLAVGLGATRLVVLLVRTLTGGRARDAGKSAAAEPKSGSARMSPVDVPEKRAPAGNGSNAPAARKPAPAPRVSPNPRTTASQQKPDARRMQRSPDVKNPVARNNNWRGSIKKVIETAEKPAPAANKPVAGNNRWRGPVKDAIEAVEKRTRATNGRLANGSNWRHALHNAVAAVEGAKNFVAESAASAAHNPSPATNGRAAKWRDVIRKSEHKAQVARWHNIVRSPAPPPPAPVSSPLGFVGRGAVKAVKKGLLPANFVVHPLVHPMDPPLVHPSLLGSAAPADLQSFVPASPEEAGSSQHQTAGTGSFPTLDNNQAAEEVDTSRNGDTPVTDAALEMEAARSSPAPLSSPAPVSPPSLGSGTQAANSSTPAHKAQTDYGAAEPEYEAPSSLPAPGPSLSGVGSPPPSDVLSLLIGALPMFLQLFFLRLFLEGAATAGREGPAANEITAHGQHDPAEAAARQKVDDQRTANEENAKQRPAAGDTNFRSAANGTAEHGTTSSAPAVRSSAPSATGPADTSVSALASGDGTAQTPRHGARSSAEAPAAIVPESADSVAAPAQPSATSAVESDLSSPTARDGGTVEPQHGTTSSPPAAASPSGENTSPAPPLAEKPANPIDRVAKRHGINYEGVETGAEEQGGAADVNNDPPPMVRGPGVRVKPYQTGQDKRVKFGLGVIGFMIGMTSAAIDMVGMLSAAGLLSDFFGLVGGFTSLQKSREKVHKARDAYIRTEVDIETLIKEISEHHKSITSTLNDLMKRRYHKYIDVDPGTIERLTENTNNIIMRLKQIDANTKLQAEDRVHMIRLECENYLSAQDDLMGTKTAELYHLGPTTNLGAAIQFGQAFAGFGSIVITPLKLVAAHMIGLANASMWFSIVNNIGKIVPASRSADAAWARLKKPWAWISSSKAGKVLKKIAPISDLIQGIGLMGTALSKHRSVEFLRLLPLRLRNPIEIVDIARAFFGHFFSYLGPVAIYGAMLVAGLSYLLRGGGQVWGKCRKILGWKAKSEYDKARSDKRATKWIVGGGFTYNTTQWVLGLFKYFHH